MALHEGMTEKRLKEHPRKRGGKLEHEKEPETAEEEAREEEHEAGPAESPGRKHGGRTQHRRAGGAVHGAKPAHRPDKKRRDGGATSDKDPLTSAGHMSSLPFERVGPKPNGGGAGKDRD